MVLQRGRELTKWAGAVLLGVLLTRAGGDLYSHFLGPRAELRISQKWEVFSLMYAGYPVHPDKDPASGFLTWLGAEPQYRHTATVENLGGVEAKDVRIEIADLSEDHKIFTEPDLLGAEVGPLEPRYMRPADAERIREPPTSFSRVVHLAALPPKAPLQIRVLTTLKGPTARLTKVALVLFTNAAAIVPPVDEGSEQALLNRLAAITFGAFPPLDLDRWQQSPVKATVEIQFNDPQPASWLAPTPKR